jgi:hypothetical protein
MSAEQVGFDTFQSWDEIFPTTEARDRHFQILLQEFRHQNSHNNPLAKEETHTNSETGVIENVFLRKGLINSDVYTSVTLLLNGDVRIIFSNSKANNEYIITPNIGGKNHDWTYDKVEYLKDALGSYLSQHGINKVGTPIYSLLFMANGKMATSGWQKIMQESGYTPIRLGFRIYPKESLEEAWGFLATSGAKE